MDYRDVKSVHIFAWPFKITQDVNRRIELYDILESGNPWVRKNTDPNNCIDNDCTEKIRKLYALKQYLSKDARDIFIGSESNCKIYEYKKDIKLQYIISLKDKEFILDIDDIFLHHYSQEKIAILFIKTINKRYKQISEIKQINEYGRRVMMPFIPVKDDNNKSYMLCAESITIKGGYGDKSKIIETKTDFRNMANVFYNDKKLPDQLKHSADFIYKILYGKLDIGDEFKCNGEIIEITDDRMFVYTLIMDNLISDKLKNYREENDEFKNLLSAIIYIDADDPCCEDVKMRDRLLENAIYSRWCGCGTIQAITNYSMVCLTSENNGINDSVCEPFLNQYIYILSLAIMQKNGILRYSEESGTVAHGVEKSGLLDKEKVESLLRLQEQYIAFKNEYLILEPTCQEQGIEIYDILQRQLHIKEEATILNEQLQSLYEAANVSNGTRYNIKGVKIAIGAIVIDVIINLASLVMGFIK